MINFPFLSYTHTYTHKYAWVWFQISFYCLLSTTLTKHKWRWYLNFLLTCEVLPEAYIRFACTETWLKYISIFRFNLGFLFFYLSSNSYFRLLNSKILNISEISGGLGISANNLLDGTSRKALLFTIDFRFLELKYIYSFR